MKENSSAQTTEYLEYRGKRKVGKDGKRITAAEMTDRLNKFIESVLNFV
jgi:hypothetical protein